MARNLRALISKLGPSWLVKDLTRIHDGSEVETDSRVLFAMALTKDSLLERTRLGVRARFPGMPDELGQLAPPDAIPHLCRDRLLVRGPTETDAGILARCQRAIDDHRVRGGAWAMLEQLRAYCAPHDVMVRLVNNHGNYYTITREGFRQRIKHTDWNWDDAPPTEWSRFWVLIYPSLGDPRRPWDRGGTWGSGGVWGTPDRTWGSTASPEDVAAVRSIVSTWKHEGSRCMGVLLVWNDNVFDPIDFAPTLPDGTWKTYGVYSGSRKVPARSLAVTYWPGT